MATKRERQLVDLFFEVGLFLALDSQLFEGKSTEEKAEWLRSQLSNAGFETIPMGSSWGYLID